MGIKREQREHKEINTRKYKQQIENLKLDIIENQEEYNTLYDNLERVINLLDESTNFTKGKLKYDSNKIVTLLREIYQFKIKD